MPPCLVIQIWDNDKFSADDFLGTIISCRSFAVFTARFRNYVGHSLLKMFILKKVRKVGPLCLDEVNSSSRNCFSASGGKFLIVQLIRNCFSVFLFFCGQECYFGVKDSEESQSYISRQFGHKNVCRNLTTFASFEEMFHRNVIVMFFQVRLN